MSILRLVSRLIIKVHSLNNASAYIKANTSFIIWLMKLYMNLLFIRTVQTDARERVFQTNSRCCFRNISLDSVLDFLKKKFFYQTVIDYGLI